MVKRDNSGDERSENGSHTNTRRQFVAGSAGALGGLAVGGAPSGSVLAQDDDGTDDGAESSDNGGFEDDVAILNYALTLEYLEARFYKRGLDNIGEDGLCNCAALEEDTDLRERVFEELRTIQEHEEQHVETLKSTIEQLGGTPVEEPNFDFGLAVQYPMAFLATAAQLEDVGVSAYAGAAPHIENPDLVPPALGIHSVEARHASFLRTLIGETGFPDVIDEPRTRAEVLELATPFIVQEGAESSDEEPMETSSDNETTSSASDGNGTSTSTSSGNETSDS